MKKYIANIISSFRILGSVLLLFFPPLSAEFYIIYLLCGFSDMIDGTVARKTNGVSEFGSKLDTVADLIFVAASLLKLLPVIQIPIWLWIWITAITIVKLGNFTRGFIREKKLISLHTKLNKITGFLMFLLPLALHFVELKYSCAVVCFAATLAAIQEWYYVVTDREVV